MDRDDRGDRDDVERERRAGLAALVARLDAVYGPPDPVLVARFRRLLDP